MKLATYNIHLAIGTDGEFSPDRIAAVIRELKVDLIALQEVELGAPAFNMLEYLRRNSGMQAFAAPTIVTARGKYGNALLTRMKPESVDLVDISFPRREPRGAMVATFAHNGAPYRVIATHLGLRPAERRHQIRKILKLVDANTNMPTILLGDLNEWFLWGRPLRWLRRRFKETPAPSTFPARMPVFALDRIWAQPRSALRDVRAHVSQLSRVASDHLPLTAVFDFSGS